MANKPCLLVVDDEPDLVQSVKDLLRFEYRVLTATRAAEALRIAETEEVQLVMSDQRMPEMTGVEFLKRLKDIRPDAVRLLFTAYADLAAVIDAINQGSVYRYIAKPWETEELRAVLRQALDHFNLQAEKRRLVQEVQRQNELLESANAELRRGDAMKRAFIKVASHELRTPLTILVSMSELAATSAADGPVDPRWLTQIQRASHRLNDRVNQMVTLLQSERFEHKLDLRETDLSQLLHEAATEVAQFVQLRNQTFDLQVAPNLGSLRADGDKLRDGIVQLLMNAVKFTPDGGIIRLEGLRLADGAAQITVTDTGKGIEAESLASIFEPFFTRLDVSKHSSGTYEYDRRGLGLGLSMVKTFVEMHSGRVSVASRPGQGTTFTIVLPDRAVEDDSITYSV
jgi:signal transduction histidine kinase